jgi:hypothetical protein
MAKDQWTPAQRREIEARAAALIDEKENWATRQAEKELAAKVAAKQAAKSKWLGCLVIIGIGFAVAVALSISSSRLEQAARERNAAEAARVAALSPEQRAAEAAAAAKAAAAQAQAVAANEARELASNPIALQVKFSAPCQVEVQHRLRDPDSAKFDYPAAITRGADGLWTVRETYRARNGFGGMNQGVAVCHIKDDGETVVDVKMSK